MAILAGSFLITCFISITLINGINCEIMVTISGFEQTNSLLQNVTNSSATMTSILQHVEGMLENQKDLQIVANTLLSNTSSNVASLLPEIIALFHDQLEKLDKHQNETIRVLLNQLAAWQENHQETKTRLQQNQTSSTLSGMDTKQTEMLNKQTHNQENESQALTTLAAMAETQTQASTTLIVMAKIQNQTSATLTQIAATQTGILNHLTQISTNTSSILASIVESQTQMVYAYNEMITTLQDMAASMNAMTSALENTYQLNLTRTEDRPTQQPISEDLPHNCLDLSSRGNYTSGVYKIKPSDSSDFTADVYCDMGTEGGGWTVFQRRFNGSVDFLRGWYDYEQGFGDVDGEHWAGLKLVNLLTRSGGIPVLRIELESFDGQNAYAEYQPFVVGDLSSNYVLFIKEYSGTAGDSLYFHNKKPFSTYDRDNKACTSGSLLAWKSGWWYKCANSNLNGQYLGPPGDRSANMFWYIFKGFQSLKASTMMLRHNP